MGFVWLVPVAVPLVTQQECAIVASLPIISFKAVVWPALLTARHVPMAQPAQVAPKAS